MAETLALTANSLRRLVCKPRFYVALLLTAGSLLLIFQNVPAFLRENSLTVQAAEPFLLVTVNRLSQLLLVLSFLLLCGDAPFFHAGMEIVFARTNKRRWLCAQILTVFAVTALWLLFALAVSILFFLPRVSFSNEWSVYLKTAARMRFGSIAVGLRGVDAGMGLLQNGKPWLVFAVSFLYNLLLFGFCGVWAVLLNLYTKRSYGSLLIVSFCALRLALGSLYPIPALERVSPMNLTDLRAFELNLSGAAHTVLFFTVQIALLWILSCLRLRRLDMFTR